MTVSPAILHQILACSPVILNQFMIGVGYGWVGPTLPKLRSPDSPIPDVDEDRISWIASISEIGKLLGPFISPLLVDNLGRKFILVLMAILYFAANVTVVLARDIHVIYITRFVFGVANGITDVVHAIYIAENCSPSVRGILFSCVVLTFFAALFIEYVVATYLSYVNAAVVNTVFSGCVFLTLYFGTETPYFLIMKGRYKRAKRNLEWLRSGENKNQVADELEKIERSVLEETSRMNEKFVERFKSMANVKAIGMVTCISVLVSLTGAGAFLMYATSILSSSESMKAEEFAILYIAAQFVSVVISPFIIEKFDRRTLIIGSSFGMTCSNVCSFVLLFLRANNYHISYYPWLIFASIATYGMFLSITSTASYAVKGEILPLSVRAIGSSMGVVSQSITTFCVLKLFVLVSATRGVETNLLLYSISSLLGTAFMYYVLPETRGKSLYEIQNSMKEPTTNDSEEAEKMLNKNVKA